MLDFDFAVDEKNNRNTFIVPNRESLIEEENGALAKTGVNLDKLNATGSNFVETGGFPAAEINIP